MENDLHVSRGPVSSMPGSTHSMPSGTVCDDHPDRPAVSRVQGETDSFGAEYHCLCQQCLDEYKAAIEAESKKESRCDWCGQMKTNCCPTRDYDEGMSGPVYDVCPNCRHKANEDARRELEESGYYDRFDYDD